MHKSFPFQCIFSASLPAFRKGVHSTEASHPPTRAVPAVQCAVRFSALTACPVGIPAPRPVYPTAP